MSHSLAGGRYAAGASRRVLLSLPPDLPVSASDYWSGRTSNLYYYYYYYYLQDSQGLYYVRLSGSPICRNYIQCVTNAAAGNSNTHTTHQTDQARFIDGMCPCPLQASYRTVYNLLA